MGAPLATCTPGGAASRAQTCAKQCHPQSTCERALLTKHVNMGCRQAGEGSGFHHPIPITCMCVYACVCVRVCVKIFMKKCSLNFLNLKSIFSK